MKKPALIGLFILGLISAGIAQVSTDEQLATQYYQDKEYDKAIPYYEKIYSKNPSNYNYHNYLDCLEQTKDYKPAEKLIKKQMHQEPANLVLWIDLGTLYRAEGDEKQTKTAFEKGIHNITSDRNQVLALGQAFLDLKEWDYALATYKKGKSIEKDDYPFLFETAAVYRAMGNISLMTDTYLDALILSPSYIQSVQDALQIDFGEYKDESKNTIIKKELLKYIQHNTDNDIFAELLIWMQIQEKNYADAFIQIKALDKRKREGGWRMLNLARTCVNNEAYDVAIEAFQYIIDLGPKGDNYSQAKTEQLKAMYQKLLAGGNYTRPELITLQTKYKQTLNELSISSTTVQLMQDLAHIEGFYLDEPDSAITLLNTAIALPDLPNTTRAYCQVELADVLMTSGRVWEASLTYSKVKDAFKQEPLGEEARLKNAILLFYTGNFAWAKAELDVLKAATTKLTANDAMALSLLINDNTQDSASMYPLQLYAHAMLLDFQNHDDSAAIYLDSIGKMNATTQSLKEELLMMHATIAIKKTDYASAAKYYQEEVKDYADGMLPDKALYLLAQLEEKKLKDPDKAAEYYKQIILNYPGSFFVEDARDRFRHLSKTDAAPTAPAPLN